MRRIRRPRTSARAIESVSGFQYPRRVATLRSVARPDPRLPRREHGSWDGRAVVIEERLDGSLCVRHEGASAEVSPAPDQPSVLGARGHSRRSAGNPTSRPRSISVDPALAGGWLRPSLAPLTTMSTSGSGGQSHWPPTRKSHDRRQRRTSSCERTSAMGTLRSITPALISAQGLGGTVAAEQPVGPIFDTLAWPGSGSPMRSARK